MNLISWNDYYVRVIEKQNCILKCLFLIINDVISSRKTILHDPPIYFIELKASSENLLRLLACDQIEEP